MPVPTKQPKRVMVIGGGPAGLEAARVAALRGHTVSIWEARDRLGGQLALSAAAPGRGELALVIRYLDSETQRLGVKVHLQTEATPELVRQEKPDAVIVATGARPYMPPIPGVITGNVVTAEVVLSGQAEIGRRVLVLGGGRVGLSTASFLVHRRKEVTVLEVMESALSQISPQESDIPALADALMRGKVDIFSCTSARAIRDGGVLLDQEGKQELWARYMFPLAMQRHGYSRYQDFDEAELSGYDSIVLALRRVPNCELGDQLRDMVSEIHTIGDAIKPRQVCDAIDEGNLVGLSI